jgi:shikimate kinase
MREREPFYAQADVRVPIQSETSLSQLVQQVWQAICARLREQPPCNP